MTQREQKRHTLLSDLKSEIENAFIDLDNTYGDWEDARQRLEDARDELDSITQRDVLQIATGHPSACDSIGVECDIEELTDMAVDFAELLKSIVKDLKQYKKLDPKEFKTFRKELLKHYDWVFDNYIDGMLKK
jgi:uncharacterized protein YpuA (DUF1002 family)